MSPLSATVLLTGCLWKPRPIATSFGKCTAILNNNNDNDNDGSDYDYDYNNNNNNNNNSEINATRPAIVIKDKRQRWCKIINVAIPSDNKTSAKVAEKLYKCKDLEIEISRMWDIKTHTTPVVIGTLEFVNKGLEKFANNIPGNINIFEIQKIVILGTAHVLRRVLSIKRHCNYKTLGPKSRSGLIRCRA